MASFIVILAVAFVIGGASAYKHMQSASQSDTSSQVSTDTSSNTSTSAAAPTPTSTSSSGTSYKDGTYAASSNYYVPNGSESIKVKLTVRSGVVTGSQIANSENNPESASFQEDFASSYKSYVVGKSLSDIHLSYVAGASDTTSGFNRALESIISQAQA